MIRKNLYITDDQDSQIKTLASTPPRIPEAEIIRLALNRLFKDIEDGKLKRSPRFSNKSSLIKKENHKK